MCGDTRHKTSVTREVTEGDVRETCTTRETNLECPCGTRGGEGKDQLRIHAKSPPVEVGERTPFGRDSVPVEENSSRESFM